MPSRIFLPPCKQPLKHVDGGTIIFSGGQKGGLYGVAVYLDNETENTLLGYNPVTERIISVRLNGKQRNVTIIQVYSPTSQAEDDEIEKFYANLQSTIESTNNRDILIIMGDFYAKLGKGSATKLIGPYGLGERNERGDRLEDFAIENDLAVTNTLFQQHKRRLYTWTSPNGEHRNQIDYILIKQKWRTSVKVAKTLAGADCGSDHELLSITLKLKMVKRKGKSKPVCYDTSCIGCEFAVEVKNKFSLLLQDVEEKDPEELAESAKTILIEAAKDHIPKREKKRAPWISQQTLDKIEERRRLKGRRDEVRQRRYKELSTDIKVACRQDKKNYIKDRVTPCS